MFKHHAGARLRRAWLLAATLLAALTGASAVATSAQAVVPSPPTGLHLQADTATSVSLAWDPVAGATGYEFFRNSKRVGSSTRNSPSVLDNYLLTAGSTWQYQVRVTTAGGTSALSSPITVTTPAADFALSACAPGTLLHGHISITANLNMTNGAAPCFDLSSNSTLDCGGHSITVTAASQTASVLRIAAGSSHSMIENCIVNTIGAGDPVNGIHVGPDYASSATAPSVDNVTLYSNTVNGQTTQAYGIDAFWATHLILARNKINQSQIGGFDDPGAIINQNTITMQSSWTGIAAPLWMHVSDNQLIGDNVINGAASGLVGRTDANGNLTGGTDDSILVDGPATGLVIRDNTLSNNYDAGIEFEGLIQNSVIDNNTISHVYDDGIGEYHNTGFENNTVTANKVSSAGRLFMFAVGGEVHDDLPTGRTYQSILNNTFANNTFTTSTRPALPGACFEGVNHYVPAPPNNYAPVPVQVSGNVATGNAFNTSAGAVYKSAGFFATFTGNTQGTTPTTSCG